MAGIVAVSSSQTHSPASADDTASGYITGDQIVLTTNPTGTNYSWALSSPSGSNALRVRFAGDDQPSASFVPDVSGVYSVVAVVDGVTYTLRLSVTQLAQSTALEALRLLPVADSQVPPPPVGVALYYSSTQGALAVKDPSNTVKKVTLT